MSRLWLSTTTSTVAKHKSTIKNHKDRNNNLRGKGMTYAKTKASNSKTRSDRQKQGQGDTQRERDRESSGELSSECWREKERERVRGRQRDTDRESSAIVFTRKHQNHAQNGSFCKAPMLRSFPATRLQAKIQISSMHPTYGSATWFAGSWQLEEFPLTSWVRRGVGFG